MKTRIKELLEQCQIETYGVNGELLEIGIDAEKFAELLIEECARIASDSGAYKPEYAIRKHFGVEE